MYYIVAYDIKDKNESYRDIIKTLRKYMKWVQNSVFEGELTESEYEKMKSEIEKHSEKGDSIIIYKIDREDNISKLIIGEELGNSSNFL